MVDYAPSKSAAMQMPQKRAVPVEDDVEEEASKPPPKKEKAAPTKAVPKKKSKGTPETKAGKN